jgi:putative tryptophan/tyrosine transport system substrate-binding protein
MSANLNRRALLSVLIGGILIRTAANVRGAEAPVRVAFLSSVSKSTAPRAFPAFWAHLRELGWVEGQNLLADTRWAEGRVEQLPNLVTSALSRGADILVTYGTPAATAARNATRSIPIVVMGMGDPVGTGLVESLARPGGNLTGLSAAFDQGFAGKWLELLLEVVNRPGISGGSNF